MKLSDPLILEGSRDDDEVGERLDRVHASQKLVFRYGEKYRVSKLENMISSTYQKPVEDLEFPEAEFFSSPEPRWFGLKMR